MILSITDGSNTIGVSDGKLSGVLRVDSVLKRSRLDYPYLGLLPPVVKYISPFSSPTDAAIVLVEAPPAYVTLKFNSDEGLKLFRVPVPWHSWIFSLRKQGNGYAILSIAMYLSDKEINSMDHKFYPGYIPNVCWYIPKLDGMDHASNVSQMRAMHKNGVLPYNGTVCLGDHVDNGPIEREEFGEFYNEFISTFWTSMSSLNFYRSTVHLEYYFNNEQPPSYYNASGENVKSRCLEVYDKLSKLTIDQVVDDLSVMYKESVYTLQDFVDVWDIKSGNFDLDDLFAEAKSVLK